MDLASGFNSILVLCFHPPGPTGDWIMDRAAAQSKSLVASGARVHVISPDEASLAAIGLRTMDYVRRAGVARAALAQREEDAGSASSSAAVSIACMVVSSRARLMAMSSINALRPFAVILIRNSRRSDSLRVRLIRFPRSSSASNRLSD